MSPPSFKDAEIPEPLESTPDEDAFAASSVRAELMKLERSSSSAKGDSGAEMYGELLAERSE